MVDQGERHGLRIDYSFAECAFTKVTAGIAVFLITALNLISNKAGSGAQVVLTGLKASSCYKDIA